MGDMWKEGETGDKTSDKQGQKHQNRDERHNKDEGNRRIYLAHHHLFLRNEIRLQLGHKAFL